VNQKDWFVGIRCITPLRSREIVSKNMSLMTLFAGGGCGARADEHAVLKTRLKITRAAGGVYQEYNRMFGESYVVCVFGGSLMMRSGRGHTVDASYG